MKYRFGQKVTRRWPWIVGLIAVVAVAAAVAIWLWVPRDPVPTTVKQAVDFPVYYPEQSKLPAGYTLDVKSFDASEQAVLYTITYGSNQKMIATVQKRPSNDDIANFYKQNIPINRKVLTTSGEAAVSAIGEQAQAIASLPTNDKSWVIIMAPADINQDEFSRVLQAIKKAD